MNKKSFSLILALLLLFAFTYSHNSFAKEEVPLFYNITLKKSYFAPMTDHGIDKIITEIDAGNEFAKLVDGKLVNYNDYRNKVIEVITVGLKLKLSEEEISGMVVEAMPFILSKLPEINVKTDNYELKVIGIY